jgi:hypothetical protein
MSSAPKPLRRPALQGVHDRRARDGAGLPARQVLNRFGPQPRVALGRGPVLIPPRLPGGLRSCRRPWGRLVITATHPRQSGRPGCSVTTKTAFRATVRLTGGRTTGQCPPASILAAAREKPLRRPAPRGSTGRGSEGTGYCNLIQHQARDLCPVPYNRACGGEKESTSVDRGHTCGRSDLIRLAPDGTHPERAL